MNEEIPRVLHRPEHFGERVEKHSLLCTRGAVYDHLVAAFEARSDKNSIAQSIT